MVCQNKLFLIVFLALIALAAACSTEPAASSEADRMMLRSYSIPEGFDAGSIRTYLQRSFASGDTKLGTAVTLPDGTLLVTAPVGLHQGVHQLIADLGRRGPQTRGPQATPVAIRYWAVIARPAASGQAVSFASDLLRKDAAVRPVLEELAVAQGPLEFTLLEQLRLTSLDEGDSSAMRGRRLKIEQRIVHRDDGAPIADIGIQAFGSFGVAHNLDTRVRLERGKFIVLAHTAFDPRVGGLPEGWTATDDLLLYYVISAEA